MSRRFLLSIVLTLAALPLVAAVVVIGMLWCIHQWNAPVWTISVLGGSLVVGMSYMIWRVAGKLAARELKFSLRAMLLGVALVALLLSTVGRWLLATYHQQWAVQAVQIQGGLIGEPGEDRTVFHSWMGYDPFERVKSLRFSTDKALAATIERSDQFPDIALLGFGRGVTGAGFEQAGDFNKFPRLRVGEFVEASIDDQGLQHLSKWTNVRELFFNGCPNVTDAGLRHLVRLPKLEQLSFFEEGGGMVITDAGLVHVGQMKQLKALILVNMPQVTDAGLTHLHGVSGLEYVVLRRTGVTEKGVTQLYQALPDCRVVWDGFVPGAAEVKQIVVTTIGDADGRTRVISEPARIGKIRALISACNEEPKTFEWSNEPAPATFSLRFMGLSRVLYEVQIGNGALQQKLYKVSNTYPDSWAKSEISDAQEFQFAEQLK
jgi:hypothetical protein